MLSNLLSGLSACELCWLLSEKLTKSVYIFDAGSASVTYATCKDVPWPVLFHLGFRHRKHRFISNSDPKMRHMVSATTDALNRIRWRAFFKDSPDQRGFPLKRLRRGVVPFTLMSPPEVEYICGRVRVAISSSALSAISATRGKKRTWSNILPIDKFAHDWLRRSTFTAVPNDKEPGFTLVSLDDMKRAQLEMLQSEWYFETCVSMPFWRNSLLPAYRNLCAEVARADSRFTMSYLCSSLESGLDGLFSHLIHTIKSTKKSGEVKFRPIHSSSDHCFRGLMVWITQVLSAGLASFPHLIHSTDQFLHKIRSFTIDRDDILVHLDLKDCFMSGKPEHLAKYSSVIVPKRFRTLYVRVVTFLLNAQFIRSRLYSNQVWKVQSGSGMGLLMSTALSNAAFFGFAEVGGKLSLLDTDSRRAFAIKQYVRYVDNLLFVCNSDFVRIRRLIHTVSSLNLPYRAQVEECSSVGITFLDVDIVKDATWEVDHRITVHPHLKDSSLRSVLSISSSHPGSIHGAWAIAYVRRLFRNSSSLVWSRSAKDEALQRMLTAGVDRRLVRHIDAHSTFTFQCANSAISGPPCDARSQHCFWIPLPFHPVYSKVVSAALRNLSVDPHVRPLIDSFLGEGVQFRTAWRLHSLPLVSTVQKF